MQRKTKQTIIYFIGLVFYKKADTLIFVYKNLSVSPPQYKIKMNAST